MPNHSKCRCGKRGYASDADAITVMIQMQVEAGPGARAERRVYECAVRPGTWHLTSQSLRDPAARPDYDGVDPTAARRHIDALLKAGDTPAADLGWRAALTPENVRQTLNILRGIHQELIAARGRRKATLPPAEYRRWNTAAVTFEKVLMTRLRAAREADRIHRQAAHHDLMAGRAAQARSVLITLGMAIRHHRWATSSDPRPADHDLWVLLDQITVPHGPDHQPTPLAEILDLVAAESPA